MFYIYNITSEKTLIDNCLQSLESYKSYLQKFEWIKSSLKKYSKEEDRLYFKELVIRFIEVTKKLQQQLNEFHQLLLKYHAYKNE